MNGIHDMGGMHGFGKIPGIDGPEPFHHDWERRMFALNFAVGGLGLWNIDMSRAEMEATPPEEYLAGDDYFRRFLLRLERLVVKHALVSQEELTAGLEREPARTGLNTLRPQQVETMVRNGSSSMRPSTRQARFQVGDRVRALRINPATHTRLPRYIRGCEGVIKLMQGVHVFPDASALGNQDQQWLYSVLFDGVDVWGKDAAPGLEIVVDAFEPYLEPA
ncbi:nitrile hydratase subunit beta [Agrobacterium sp. LAD9]|uniref:nitrile hydratase subunit beta n=1 Tax=Agrobacterium sp. LAD9 TaxID=2055153 RepID=UPI000D1DEEBA|nr:nitrile hydratase subunit beta [Agrobacterium sp. LAD9]